MDCNAETEESEMAFPAQTRQIRRPFKVAGQARKFKGVVAGSLEELKEKALRSLDVNIPVDNAHFYLEIDGTEIDDEEYFQFLQSNDRILVLKEEDFEFTFGPGSRSQHSSSRVSIERSESQVLIADTDATDAGRHLALNVVDMLKTNPTFFVHLSEDDLEQIVDYSREELSKVLGRNLNECNVILQACSKELERRHGLKRATELLHMYQRATEAGNDQPRHKTRRAAVEKSA